MRIEHVSAKVLTSKKKRDCLNDLQRRYSDAVQYALDFSEANGKTSSIGKLHKGCYYAIRERFNLPSEYASVALRQAQGMIHGYWGQVKSPYCKKVSWPRSREDASIGLGLHSYEPVYDCNRKRWTLRVSLGKRTEFLWLPLCLPEKYKPTMMKVYGQGHLFERDGEWYVSLPMRCEDRITPIIETSQFFGIDLGIAKIATLVGPGVVRFWSGKGVQNRRRQFQQYRKRMGRKKRLDRIRQQRNKESRWQKDINHKISCEIVDIVANADNGVIVLEKLDGIRGRVRGSKRFNRMMSNWAFRQLADMIVYKAARAGIPVVWIDPRKTSQTCSRCGHATRANRPDQAHFRCVSCGYQANSDYNAAVNISRKGAIRALRCADWHGAEHDAQGAYLEQGHLMVVNTNS